MSITNGNSSLHVSLGAKTGAMKDPTLPHQSLHMSSRADRRREGSNCPDALESLWLRCCFSFSSCTRVQEQSNTALVTLFGALNTCLCLPVPLCSPYPGSWWRQPVSIQWSQQAIYPSGHRPRHLPWNLTSHLSIIPATTLGLMSFLDQVSWF